MGNNVSLGYDEVEQHVDEQQQQQQHVDEQQQQQHVDEQQQQQQQHVDEQQQQQQEQENLNKNDTIKKSSIKNKECANAPASESMPDSSKIKKRKQTVRNSKELKKAGKTKSNKRIIREYKSRYNNEKCNGEREQQQRATSSTLLNSD